MEKRYGKSQLDCELYSVLAVSSIYGIDILADNVRDCRRRLLEVFDSSYTRFFKAATKNKCREAVRFIFERNITWGDDLTLSTVDEKRSYIVFSEWSPNNGSKVSMRGGGRGTSGKVSIGNVGTP